MSQTVKAADEASKEQDVFFVYQSLAEGLPDSAPPTVKQLIKTLFSHFVYTLKAEQLEDDIHYSLQNLNLLQEELRAAHLKAFTKSRNAKVTSGYYPYSALATPENTNRTRGAILSQITLEYVKDFPKQALDLILYGLSNDSIFRAYAGLMTCFGKPELVLFTILFWEQEIQHLKGLLPVQIYAAVELTEAQKEVIISSVNKVIGRKFIPYFYTKPELLAGLIIKSDLFEFDDSLSGRLKALKLHLNNEVLYG